MPKRAPIKNYISLILFGLLICYAQYKGCAADKQRELLRKEGLGARAFVYDSYKIGSKGDVENKFFFAWNKHIYYGSCLSADITKGDSIDILFLPKNPEISRLKDER